MRNCVFCVYESRIIILQSWNYCCLLR